MQKKKNIFRIKKSYQSVRKRQPTQLKISKWLRHHTKEDNKLSKKNWNDANKVFKYILQFTSFKSVLIWGSESPKQIAIERVYLSFNRSACPGGRVHLESSHDCWALLEFVLRIGAACLPIVIHRLSCSRFFTSLKAFTHFPWSIENILVLTKTWRIPLAGTPTVWR